MAFLKNLILFSSFAAVITLFVSLSYVPMVQTDGIGYWSNAPFWAGLTFKLSLALLLLILQVVIVIIRKSLNKTALFINGALIALMLIWLATFYFKAPELFKIMFPI